MAANAAYRENDLICEAVAWLRERLPATWSVETSTRPELTDGPGRADAAIEIRGSGIYATLAVEAKRAFGPREVASLFGSVGRTLRVLSPNISILLVAPWLSARTRDLLTAEGVNYIDLTGNALIRLENPALFVMSQGADRDPSPAPRAKARVRGPKAGRLIRTLVDVRPPYGVRELTEATHLAAGYISRLLDALDHDALIERGPRGRVESVDLAGLLRRWAETYELFGANAAQPHLAPRGAKDALAALAQLPPEQRVAVTGSFAAVRISAVAAPALLTVYAGNPRAVADALGLLPAEHGANVVLLRPFDQVVWAGAEEEGGVRYVAPSQVAIDCLTGNGRMPVEGEALVEWLLANESAWRFESLADVGGQSE